MPRLVGIDVGVFVDVRAPSDSVEAVGVVGLFKDGVALDLPIAPDVVPWRSMVEV